MVQLVTSGLPECAPDVRQYLPLVVLADALPSTVEFLRGRGVDAVNVAGGTLAWIEAGHPVDTGGGAGA